MKCPVIYLAIFCFPAFCLPAQSGYDYKSMDRHAQKAPAEWEEDLAALTGYLIQPARNDFEKARGIYVWITHRIRYDNDAYTKDRKRINQTVGDILRRKMAVCSGYASLFKAMCDQAGLSAVVVTGYSKGTLTARPELEEPDHAWNAVQLEGQWYLLDATWGSSLIDKTNDFVQTFREGYFLTSPAFFITNHLPADPMWQLLDCPLDPQGFQLPADSILARVQHAGTCFNYRDSIEQYIRLPETEKALKKAQNTYRFHPSGYNKSQLGHANMDYAGRLSDQADSLQEQGVSDSLITLQETILQACREAAGLTELYAWQKELYANTLINQAVAWSKKVEALSGKEQKTGAYKKSESCLLQALQILETLEESYFAGYAAKQCRSYLAFVRQELVNLEKRD